jgi:ParB family chromosome partitioning protein
MQPALLDSSSTKSNPAPKGSQASATQAADAAFASQSSLSLEAGNGSIPADQQGRRRLADAFLIRTDRLEADPNQPRREFDSQQLAELADSIRERGIKQPLTVRWEESTQKYRVIDGGRRFQVAVQLGVVELPCWIQQTAGKELLIDQVVHNWQRAELSPTDMASALGRLRDEHGLTQQDIARLTGKPKGEISKYLAIYDHTSDAVKEIARTENDGAKKPVLSKRHLYNISRLPADQQDAVAQLVARDGLSAMETERLVDEKVGVQKRQRHNGVASRTRRISTPLADIVLTFRKAKIEDSDVTVALRQALAKHTGN